MASKMELEQPRTGEVSKEQILARLRKIADYGAQPTCLDTLDEFVQSARIMQSFDLAINDLGVQDAWFGNLIKGAYAGQDRYVSATYQRAPSQGGGSCLHIYAREGDVPSFGVFIPFNPDGSLDRERTVSASSFLSNNEVQVFYPKETIARAQDQDDLLRIKEPTSEEAAYIAMHIALTTEMAAATLVSLIEVEDISRDADKSVASG